jgi:hypothetical protein
MNNTTFVWNDVRITIHPLTAEDEMDAEIKAILINDGKGVGWQIAYKEEQVTECWQSFVSAEGGEFSLPIPNGNATPDELKTAYDAFLQSVGLLKRWRAALRSIEVTKK